MSDKPVRVLVVEDDLVDRLAFERFMKSRPHAYDHVIADSARAAREHLASEHFDLVISDYRLGDGTCLDLLSEHRHTPFIVVTGTGSEETAVEAMRLGARDYLIKDPEGSYLTVLPATVKNVLERCEAEAELNKHREHLEELVRQRTAELIAQIEDRLRAEKEKQALREQLVQAQKMEAIGLLASGVAHDFNNLLTVIFGNLDLIREQLSDAQAKAVGSSLEHLQEAAQQAIGLTRALLTFARRVPGEKKSINLSQTVEKTVKLIRRVLPASIELVAGATETPIWAYADETQVQQVIMNLAVNARDAMPQGGRLSIALNEVSAEKTGLVCLTVSDTGTGMAPEVQARIFEPFFTTKPRGSGTGLGLSIIHGIVEEHGGRIEVSSVVGQGTTFKVFLPRGQADTGLERQGAPERTRQGAGEQILLAEDHEHIASILTRKLQADGYRVIGADNGESLLEAYRQHGESIRLFLFDVDLPKRSGMDCLQRLREEGCRTPAILMTGSMNLDSTQIPPGCTRLLRKPFQIADLTRVVDEMLAPAEHSAKPE